MLYSDLYQLALNIHTLSTLTNKQVEDESEKLKISNLKVSDLKLSDLNTKAFELITLLKDNENKFKALDFLISQGESYTDEKYLAGSKVSANNKGIEVLKRLEELNINLENYGFISLGGGDGTELYTEIENSKANFGLLLEYDFNSVHKFVKNHIPFCLQNFDRWDDLNIEVIECDLFDKFKLGTAKEIIEKQNLNGIIVSIHAVLHELSTRSQLKSNFIDDNGNIDLEEFFKEINEWHDNIIVVIREPGTAENWPKKVNLTINDEHIADFKQIIEEIDNSHFDGTKGPNFSYRDKLKEFTMDRDLAIESLTKLFYKVDYHYEKREQITSVSREQIMKALRAGGKLFTIEKTEPFFTGSVQSNMNNFGVKVTKNDNIPLANPQCFSYTIAAKGSHAKKI